MGGTTNRKEMEMAKIIRWLLWMTKSIYLSAKEIAEALNGSPSGDGWVCRCPNSLHRDSKPSFSIRDGDSGRPVFHCFGGCTQDDLIDALRAEGLWPDRSERREGNKPKATARTKPRPTSNGRARRGTSRGSSTRRSPTPISWRAASTRRGSPSSITRCASTPRQSIRRATRLAPP